MKHDAFVKYWCVLARTAFLIATFKSLRFIVLCLPNRVIVYVR